jgi:hypothetical protein
VAQQTAQPATNIAPLPPGTYYDLAQFGPYDTAAKAQQTLEKATTAIQDAGGGVLVLPADAPKDWHPVNDFQENWRKPAPPAPATQWGTGPGVTIIDARDSRVLLPQSTGLNMVRTFQTAPDDSAPHWNYNPMLGLNDNVVSGGSFSGQLNASVAAGKDQRFYVASLGGLAPGVTLSAMQAGKEAGKVTVKSFGYDKEQKQPFFIADASGALKAGATLFYKTVLSNIKVATNANNELQTFDVMDWRYHYSQGDSYLFDGYYFYAGDNGDKRIEATEDGARGTAVYSAMTHNLTNIFRGKVSKVDPKNGVVEYSGGVNPATLATGRPLINLNPQKTIVGRAYVMYPWGILGLSGSIRSKEATWTKDVVGRWFTVDEPSEYVPGGDKVRRWYLITRFEEKDGVKMLSIRRSWWGAKQDGGLTTLNPKNYTTKEDNPKLLSCIIAPGANVYDVAGATEGAKDGIKWKTSGSLKVVPYADSGGQFDFAPGDPVEQPIGAIPFRPIPYRAWLWDAVPGVFPAPVIDIANSGDVPRSEALRVGGKSGFNAVFGTTDLQSVNDAIVIRGKVNHAAVWLHQPDNTMQFITWRGIGNLGVYPQNGNLFWAGSPGGWNLKGRSFLELSGLGGRNQAQPLTNFRGVRVPVPAGQSTFSVAFPTPEPGKDYTVRVETSWPGGNAVTERTEKGFAVAFEKPAPQGATLNWLLMR